jgi:Flp pilus assembly protein TadD
MPRIFISYRRDDTQADAGRLFETLAANFGEHEIFRDVDNILVGEDFADAIDTAISAAVVVIVLIGPDWMDQNRLANERDYVRLEIEVALRRRTVILPIVVRRARMPSADQLPDPIRKLSTLNAADVEHHSWGRDTSPLVATIRSLLSRSTEPIDVRRRDQIAQLLLDRNFVASTQALKQYLRDHPRDALAWNMLGGSYEATGDFELAAHAYDTALSFEPDQDKALVNRGILKRKTGDYSRAYDDYVRALEINPHNAEAHTSLATLLLGWSRDREALDHAMKAYELHPDSAVIVANLAIACHYANKRRARKRFAKEARRKGYQNMDGLNEIFSGARTVRIHSS